MAILDMAEHLVWQDIHGEIQGASRRAFLALKTVLNFFSADLKNLRLQGHQGHIAIACLPDLIHSFTPVLGRGDVSRYSRGIVELVGNLRLPINPSCRATPTWTFQCSSTRFPDLR